MLRFLFQLIPGLLLLPTVSLSAQDEPADPLAGNRSLISANELALIWGDPEVQGTAIFRKLYDYTSFGNPEIQDSLQAQDRDSTDGAFGLTGDKALDAVVADFNDDGMDQLLVVWEGVDGSVVASFPSTGLETGGDLPRLVWGNAPTFELHPTGTLADLRQNPRRQLRLISGQFDDDMGEEALLAFWGADTTLQIELYDVGEATLTPITTASTVGLPPRDAVDRIDQFARFDVATLDTDEDGLDEIALAFVRNLTDGCPSDRCWEVGVGTYQFDGGGLSMVDEVSLSTKLDNDNRWIERIALEPGDFDGDGRAELALGFEVGRNTAPAGVWYLQGLEVDSDAFLLADLDAQERVDQETGTNGYPLSLTSGDLDQDGRDDLIYLGRSLDIFSSDTLFSGFNRIAGDVVATRPNETGRRSVVLTDLDSGSEMWYGEATNRPEIVVASNIQIFEQDENDNDGYVQLQVFRFVDAGANLERLLSRREEKTENSGVRPLLLITGDFGDRGIRVGPPRYYRQTDIVQPLVILNAPPLHFDVFDSTPFDVSGCYSGGECGFGVTYLERTEQTVEVTSEVRGDWQLGAGIEGNLNSILDEIPVAGELVANLLDALEIGVDFSFEASYGEGFSELVGSRQTIQVTSRVQTTEDDAIYADVIDYDIWEYPLYVRSRFAGYIAIVLPGERRDQWFASRTPEAARYRPNHVVGNILSYPRDLEPRRQVQQVFQGSRYTLSTSSILWDVTREQTTFSESAESTRLQLSGDVDISLPIPTLSVNFNGDYARETVNTHRTSVSNLQGVTVELGRIETTLEGKGASYSVTPFVYWDVSGSLVVDYAVEPSIAGLGEVETWWQDRYGQAPDAALALPELYEDVRSGVFVDEATRTRTRSLAFFPDNVAPGEPVTLQVLAHNYSLLPLPNDIPVRFYLGNPDEGGIPITGGAIADPRLPPMEARGSSTASVTWTVPSGLQDLAVRIYAVLDPDNTLTEIHKTNNKGWAPLRLDATPSVDTEEDSTPLPMFTLHSNYPNPFTTSTTLAFSVDRPQPVRLRVFDVLGREVARLVDNVVQAGRHEVVFDARRYAGGLYVVRLEADDRQITRTMLLVR